MGKTHGDPWISMDIHEYQWISMDNHVSAAALLRARRVELLGLVFLIGVWFLENCQKGGPKNAPPPWHALGLPPQPAKTAPRRPKTRQDAFFVSVVDVFLDRFFN